jgi:hypothetical protein
MQRQLGSAVVLLFVPAMLASCSAAPATTTARPTARPAPTSTPTQPAATPSPTPVVPPGPYSVIVTNAPRLGSTYDVLLIDVVGHVIARVTAKLPLLKPNQTIQLPLVSASADLAYYLDGDTTIRSLSPSGTTALAKTISEGSSSILAFAVSPDDHRIAVSLISQGSDTAHNTSHGYVEGLTDGANRVNLFSNTAVDALRWPVGWDGAQVVDAAGACGEYGYGYINGNSSTAPCSFHVINSATASRTATLCESPSKQPPGENYNESVNGLPVASGIACTESVYYYGPTPNTAKLLAVDWSGHETAFLTGDSQGNLPYGNCFLAPTGARMACTANTSQALNLLAPGAAPHNLGRRYNVLGWIDGTHIAVDIDSATIGVLSTDTGAVVTIALTNADKMQMAAIMPGAL